MSLGNRPVLSQVGPHRPPDHLHQDLLRVRATLLEAELAGRPADRYLADRGRRLGGPGPAQPPAEPSPQRLAAVGGGAAELAEWAGFFAAEEGKREASGSG